jgi:glycosyltransferase involved in cell wall biosynthesis
MRVAITMPLAEQRGGSELALRHLVRETRGGEVEWLVVFLEDGPMVEDLRSLGIETTVVPAGRLRQAHRYLRTVVRLARLFRTRRVDLAVGWMAKAHLYSGPAAYLARVPALWYQHGMPGPRGALDRIATLLPARGVLTVSRAAADAQGRLWPRRTGGVVHPGVELERFDPGGLPSPLEARRRLGLPSEGPIVGTVGRLQRWKGIHVLIDALPSVLESHPDARCVIVGGRHELEPDYPSYLEERIDALGVREHVVMAGLRPDVPDWMQAMDVMVHASDHEPFGMVVVEAMALGKPVVASDTAGPTEVITDGVDGLLTAYGDAGSLAGAILRYLGDPSFAREVGSAARERARDFSTKRYAETFIATIRDIAGAGASRL